MLSEQPVTFSCHFVSFLHHYLINMKIDVNAIASQDKSFVLINSNEDNEVIRLVFLFQLKCPSEKRFLFFSTVVHLEEASGDI